MCDAPVIRVFVGVVALAAACCGMVGFLAGLWYFGYNTDHKATPHPPRMGGAAEVERAHGGALAGELSENDIYIVILAKIDRK